MDISLFSAFSLGLAGAGHCLGMCGGVAAALNLGSSRAGASTTLAYHGGRILSYTALGGLLGFATSMVDLAAATLVLRYLAGVMLVAMGLYIVDWWRGLVWLERGGARLWRPVQRWSSRWLPIRNWRQSLALGLCWGLMPCGLIYSSLAWAATAQNAASSALLMFCFGLGTLPAMLATSFSAQRIQALLRSRGLKLLLGLLLIVSGMWTLYLVHSHAPHILMAAEPATSSDEQPMGDHSHHH